MTRAFTVLVWLGMVISGCGPSTPFGVLDGLREALDNYNAQYGTSADFEADLASCDAEIAAYDQAVAELQTDTQSDPDLSIRIENMTEALAAVTLAIQVATPPQPVYPECGYYYYGGPVEFYYREELSPLVSKTVVVAANGTATGTVPCGEILGVSVSAPIDFFFYLPAVSMPDFYLNGGNVIISGLGSTGETDFDGDVLAGARIVDLIVDEIDCETSTFVLRVLETATTSIFDTDTGSPATVATPGRADLSLE